MEDDIDIYEDLPSFDNKFDENFVANQPEKNTPNHVELEKQIKNLTEQLESLRKVNENLELNLVSLLKTAKAEIARKDKMIENLRKELDDVTFRRGVYLKKNDRKPTFTNPVVPIQHNIVQVQLPARENKQESSETNLSLNITKNSSLSKPTLAPNTVFSERLRKRLTDEENSQRKEKQLSKFNDKCRVPTTEGYIIESDKENGSLVNTDSSSTREMQLSTVKQNPENEQFTRTHFPANQENQPNFRYEEKPTIIANIVQKRANDETYGPACVKRFKFEEGEHVSRSSNKQSCENVTGHSTSSNGILDHTNTNKYELLETKSEQRRATHLDSQHTRYTLVREDRRHNYVSFTDCADKTSQRDTSEHTLKRNCKSTASTITSAERYTNERRVDLPSNHNYRSSIPEYHRIKRREDGRTNEMREDRRSRGRQPSSENYREDKYLRNKYKYAGYEEKSEKRYATRSTTGTVKSATVRKESRISRNTDKQLTTERNSICSAELLDHHDDYRIKERLRNSNKTTRRDQRQEGRNEYLSHQKSVRKNVTDHERHSETTKSEKVDETNKTVEKIDSCKFTENGKTAVTLDDSSMKKNSQCIKMNADEGKDGSTNNSNGLKNKDKSPLESNDLCKDSDKVEELPSVLIVTNMSTACVTTVVPLNEQCCEFIENVGNNETVENVENNEIIENVENNKTIRNVENNEIVENVENIEKFIRNYIPSDDHSKKNLDEKDVTLETANKDKSTKNDDLENKMSFEEQQRDATCLDGTKRESNTKLNTINSRVTLQDQESHKTETDGTTAVTESVESVNDLAIDGNCAFQTSVVILEGNYSMDFAPDKASENLRTGTASVSLISSATDNTSPSIASEFSKQNCNVNDSDIDNIKSNGESCVVSASKDSDADKINGNSNYKIHDIDKDKDKDKNKGKGEDKNKDNGDIGIHVGDIGNNCSNTAKKEKTNNPDRECPLSKSAEEVQKEKEHDKSTTEKRLRELDKPSVNNGTNAKVSSMNFQGKMIVFARRKKPVCLANNNANMTVLINNCHNRNTS